MIHVYMRYVRSASISCFMSALFEQLFKVISSECFYPFQHVNAIVVSVVAATLATIKHSYIWLQCEDILS